MQARCDYDLELIPCTERDQSFSTFSNSWRSEGAEIVKAYREFLRRDIIICYKTVTALILIDLLWKIYIYLYDLQTLCGTPVEKSLN
jgi:hypothetical protein